MWTRTRGPAVPLTPQPAAEATAVASGAGAGTPRIAQAKVKGESEP